jgi:Cof subfamily protein (haloacid dehalogenase superfamily)
LIGLDLDGTVIDEHNEIQAATINALGVCHEAGIHLAFLTGRRLFTGRPKIEAIGLPAGVATSSGCVLWDYPGWRMLARQRFPAELVVPVAKLLSPHSVSFYVGDENSGVEFVYLKRLHNPRFDDFRKRYVKSIKEITDPEELKEYSVVQLALPGEEQVVNELCDRIVHNFDSQLLALSVRWPLIPTFALEVFHPLGNKGAALQYFAERLGVPQQRCVAVGDDTNDLQMIEWAGHGVTMPQARDLVKAAADEALEGDGCRTLAPFLLHLASLPG